MPQDTNYSPYDSYDNADLLRVDGGVADLATKTHIYEVDRLAKWHEGIGQVLHYRDESGKQGMLVLILPDGYIEKPSWASRPILNAAPSLV